MLAAVALGGCAVGRELGTGAPMVGLTTQTVNDSIASAGAWGGFIGNAGALLGVGAPAGLAASLLTWLAGRAAKKREDAAWDESARDAERQALISAIAGGGRNTGGGAAGGGVGTQEES